MAQLVPGGCTVASVVAEQTHPSVCQQLLQTRQISKPWDTGDECSEPVSGSINAQKALLEFEVTDFHVPVDVLPKKKN